MKSEESARSGPRPAKRGDDIHVFRRIMLAVHRRQDSIRSRLHRQVQERHQLRQIAVRRDQIRRHVVGMARRIADAGEAGDRREAMAEIGERGGAAGGVAAVIGVDVLAEQADFAHPCVRQPCDLFDDRRDGARIFRAARVGHHAERAETVAALLDRDEGARAAPEHRLRGGRDEVIELRFDREICLDDRPPRIEKLRQAVIALRTDDEIDRAGAAQDLVACGLCHAAGRRRCVSPCPPPRVRAWSRRPCRARKTSFPPHARECGRY